MVSMVYHGILKGLPVSKHHGMLWHLPWYIFIREVMYIEKNLNANIKVVRFENVMMHNYRARINYRLLLLYSSRHGPNFEQLFFWH